MLAAADGTTLGPARSFGGVRWLQSASGPCPGDRIAGICIFHPVLTMPLPISQSTASRTASNEV